MPEGPVNDDARHSWEMLLRQMLGEEGAREAMAALEANGFDPEAMARGAGLPTDPASLQAMMAQMQRMVSTGDGTVNWSIAHDVARQTAHAEGDPSLSSAQSQRAIAALGVADLWLDAATDLAPAAGARQAWSRAQWVEGTLPTWRRLTTPVGNSVAEALAETVGGQVGDLPLPGGGDMLKRLGGSVFGMQLGQAAGMLAREAFGTSDTGLPLVEGHGTALVLHNIEEFATGLDASPDEVLHLIAVRETAHARLFGAVPWLRPHLLSLVEEYARGISIDVEAMEEAVRSIDVTDPEALREALSGGVFAMDLSPEQAAALDRLETALALVEGWVEDVTARAVAPHLSHAVPLREMLRRRRAAGGPAEHAFSTLVGLELRPRKLREAAALFASLHSDGGPAARDALWEHPDLLPDSADLDDGASYLARRAAAREADAELDAALAEILGAAEDSTGGEDPGAGGEPGADPTAH